MLAAAAALCSPTGCDGSGSGPQLLVQPFPARARLCLGEMDEAVSAGWVLLPRAMGAMGCSHPGPPSVPSRLDPLQGESCAVPRAAGPQGLRGGLTLQRGTTGPAAALQAALLLGRTIPVLQAEEEALGRLVTVSHGGTEPGMCWHMWRDREVRGSPLGRAPLRAGHPSGVSPLPGPAPWGQQLGPRTPTVPGRVLALARGAQPGTGHGGDRGDLSPTGRWCFYPVWVVCRCVRSRWCSTWQPRGSRCRCHTAPGRVPGTPAAPRGTRRASQQHGGSLVTTGTAAVPGSCFLQRRLALVPIVPPSHPLVLPPVPRLTGAGAVTGCVCSTGCHSRRHALPGAWTAAIGCTPRRAHAGLCREGLCHRQCSCGGHGAAAGQPWAVPGAHTWLRWLWVW